MKIIDVEQGSNFTNMEIWKNIPGYEGKYKVSNLGNVLSVGEYRTCKKGLIKTFIDKRGYSYVSFGKQKKRIHRIVADAFISNPLNKETVNHKNGIKTDNRVSNLEWNTRSENELHSYRVLGKINPMKGRIGPQNPFSKKVSQFDLSWNHMNDFTSIKEAQDKTGAKSSHIGKVCAGKRKSAGGCKWKFAS